MNIFKYSKTMVSNNFPALTHKNFRTYWLGQCVSLIGTWVQSIGQTWLVLSLTGSPLLLGILGAIQFLPITLFSLFAGVIIDRYPKKQLILMTQFTSMILAFTLSALVFTHTVNYEYILILALILGFSNTIDMPTRQAFTIELAGKNDLMNAIALNSASFNLAVIISLDKVKVTPYVRKKISTNNMLKEIKDGLKYIRSEPSLLQTILMVLIIGIFVFNFNIIIPVFTKNILHQQEKIYGLLLSALGAGSLVGALMVSVKSRSGPNRKVLVRSAIIVSITLILISFTRTYYHTAALLVITGIFNIWFSTTANSTLQITSTDEYRGRVMSVYSLVFAGASPIGNMFAGITTDLLGANTAFLLSGVLTLVFIGLLRIFFKLGQSQI